MNTPFATLTPIMLILTKKRLLYVGFHFLLFFIFIAHSLAGVIYTCKPNEIKADLIELDLDPDLTTNQELITAISSQYGSEIHNLLTENHPTLLHNPDARFDNKTLQWAINTIWDPKSPNARYLLLLGDIFEDSVIDDYIKIAYSSLFISMRRTSLVFFNNLDFVLFQLRVESELDLIIKKIFPDLSENSLKRNIHIFKEKYFTEGAYIIGSLDNKINNPIIIIDGHGMAGGDYIKVGDTQISYTDIVKKLIAFKVPSDAFVKLNSCFSGCAENKLDLTIKDIKQKFYQGILTEEIGIIKGSFLYTFSQHLFQQIPSFNGRVEGYLGTVFSSSVSNVLKKNGSIMPIGNATKVTGTDGNIRLKQEESSVHVTRADFN